jgi:hypothetical protein
MMQHMAMVTPNVLSFFVTNAAKPICKHFMGVSEMNLIQVNSFQSIQQIRPGALAEFWIS